MKKLTALVIALVVFFGGMHCFAEANPAPAITSIDGGNNNSGYVVGWSFIPKIDIDVTHLGIYDENGNGNLDEPQAPMIGIWDSSQTLLVSTNVALSAANENSFFYTPVTRTSLSAGQTYVIGAMNYTNGERFRYDAALQTTPAIEWIDGRFTSGSALVFPDKSRTQATSYFGPSFKFSTSSELPATVSISTPSTRTVFQRNSTNRAHVAVSGTCFGEIDAVKVKVTPRADYSGTSIQLTDLDSTPKDGTYSGALWIEAGWYDMEVVGFFEGQAVSTGKVERVGVGETFITCGQSNSANYGSPKQTPADDRVSCSDMNTWRHAADSQPIASGTGGSPWPAFGDKLAEFLDVPVGIISLGVGSTRVKQWVPGADLYHRIRDALAFLEPNGCRAVLWHQGESDSISATSTVAYRQRLESIISQSRSDCGYDVPWGVAIASYHPRSSTAKEANISNAQWQIINNDPLVFKGAETDEFHNLGYLHDTVHFNATGLTEHGHQWARAVRKQAFPKPASPLRLSDINMVSPDTLQIEWSTESNVTYQLQSSTSLTNNPIPWTDVGAWRKEPADSELHTYANLASSAAIFFESLLRRLIIDQPAARSQIARPDDLTGIRNI